MKKAVIVFVLGLVTAVAAYAQGTPQTKSGDMALMFSINGFGDFGIGGNEIGSVGGSDSGGFISPVVGPGMRFFIADDMALRVALGFNTTSRSVNDSTDGPSNMAFGIAPAIEVHVMKSGPVTFYTGGGISFATSSRSQGADSTKSTATQTSFGVGVLIGAEFFAWNNLSFGAEYMFGLNMSSSSSEFGSTNVDGPGETSIGFSGPARVTIALTI